MFTGAFIKIFIIFFRGIHDLESDKVKNILGLVNQKHRNKFMDEWKFVAEESSILSTLCNRKVEAEELTILKRWKEENKKSKLPSNSVTDVRFP